MRLKELSVFVVDDDSSFNLMLTKTLKKKGISDITSFKNGEDCVANLHQDPDIVILDYNLENSKGKLKTGLQVAEIIKRECPSSFIILLSGEMHEDLNRFTDQRFVDNIDRYLVKGIDQISGLLEAINEYAY